MSERATVYEDAILGIEAAPGDGAGNLYRLLATDFTLDQVLANRVYRKRSAKYYTHMSRGKEHSQGTFNGDQSINDMLFLLRGLVTQGAVTTPSNNGVWSISLGGATAGNFTLTYGAQTTANIAYNASAAAVKAALVLLSSIGGPDNISVTGTGTALDPYIVTFKGDLSTGGALTGTFAGLTGATSPAATSTAGGTVRRWTLTSLWNSADTPQTFEIQKGVSGNANEAAQATMMYVQSANMKWSVDEASISGDFFADKLVDPFTMDTSGITDLTLAPVDPQCVSAWLGDNITGATGRPTLMTRLFDVELSLGPKWSPLKTLNCADDGISAGVEAQPGAQITFSIEHNTDSQDLIADIRAGDTKYMVLEAIGPDISAAYPYRFKFTTPIKITNVTRDDMGGVFVSKYTGEICYTTDMGSAIKFEIDTTYASF